MVFLALLTFLLLLGKVNTWPRARISSEKQPAGKKRFFGEKSVDRQSEVRVAAYQIDSSRFFYYFAHVHIRLMLIPYRSKGSFINDVTEF